MKTKTMIRATRLFMISLDEARDNTRRVLLKFSCRLVLMLQGVENKGWTLTGYYARGEGGRTGAYIRSGSKVRL